MALAQAAADDALRDRLLPAGVAHLPVHLAAAGDRRDEPARAQAHDVADVVAECAVQLVDHGVDDLLAARHRREARAEVVRHHQVAGAPLQAVGLGIVAAGPAGLLRGGLVLVALEAPGAEVLWQVRCCLRAATAALLLAEQQCAVGLLDQLRRGLRGVPLRDAGGGAAGAEVLDRVAHPLDRALCDLERRLQRLGDEDH